MPRPLALLLTIAFVFYLFRRDVRERPEITGALWIPLIWLLLSGSKFVSQWIGGGGASLEDGSPLDRAVFIGLIVSGLIVLTRRRISISEVVRNNGWLTVYFLYCFAAIFWSDFQYVSFKRWIKTIGEPVMVLVVLTEPNVTEAVNRLIKRSTYLLAPFSIMLIKYFPEMGRHSSDWGGMESGGVTGGKNALGADCLLLGFFLFCHFVKTRNLEKTDERKRELWFTFGLLWMIWWNLIEASSSTALVALIVGMLTVVALGRSFVVKRLVGVYVLVGVVTLFLADTFFGLFAAVIHLLGEDSTLTGRTELWQDILAINTHPLLGTGFESFWLGDRLKYLWSLHWWKPNEAHNGYLETYVNLGLVGLGIMIALLIATYRKGRRALLDNFEYGRMRLGFLAAVIVYNWTEASFRALHIVFFGFYIIALDYPNREVAAGTTLRKPPTPDSQDPKGLRDSRWSPVRRPAAGHAARTITPRRRGVPMNWHARSIAASRHNSKT